MAKFVPGINEGNSLVSIPGGYLRGVKASFVTTEITFPSTLFNITSYVPPAREGNVATKAPVSVEVDGPTVVHPPEEL